MTSTNSRTLKAIVVDDERPAWRNLRALLKDCPDIELLKECGDGRDAVSSIRALEPDLVFLELRFKTHTSNIKNIVLMPTSI